MTSTAMANRNLNHGNQGKLQFPGSYDEAPLTLQLYGRNESNQVVVNGWTRRLPLKFPGLKEDLKIKSSDPARHLVDLKMINCAVKLSELATKTGRNYAQTPYPAIVYILAKKALEVIVKEKQLLIFGEMIIGDDTGFCEVHVCNNSVLTLYQQVNVGDKVIIGVGNIGERGQSKSARDEVNWCLDENNVLNLDFKINCYDCRRIIKLNSMNHARVLPACYTDRRQIFTISNLLNPGPGLGNCDALRSQSDSYHFDTIGVISHVGRMERYREFAKEVLLTNGEEKLTPFFRAFRWIEMMDNVSHSIVSLQLYVNQDLWPLQSSIVPGSLIIVTNVQRQLSDYLHPTLTSTRFSQVYVNKDIRQYSNLLPGRLKQVITECLGADNARILTSKNVTWSAGGTYATPFVNDEKFVEYVNTMAQLNPSEPKVSLRHLVRPGTDECRFFKRETKRLVFKGFIIKYAKVHDKGRDVMKQNTNRNMRDECSEDYEEFNSTEFCFPNENWYMFTRKLPFAAPKRPRSPKKSEELEAYEKQSSNYKKYCDSLGMPVTGDPQLLKDLPALDCFPLFMVQIVNQDADPHEKYFCVWKSSRFMTCEQMEFKLEEVVNSKTVYFMVDVHYIDDRPDKVFEIILQDLAAEPGQ